jgi:hypothetical protein
LLLPALLRSPHIAVCLLKIFSFVVIGGVIIFSTISFLDKTLWHHFNHKSFHKAAVRTSDHASGTRFHRQNRGARLVIISNKQAASSASCELLNDTDQIQKQVFLLTTLTSITSDNEPINAKTLAQKTGHKQLDLLPQ